jgi:hypothetical protein
LPAAIRPATIGGVLHAVSVRPVRVRLRGVEHGADVLRGVGFRWVCSCGDRGKRCDDVEQARAGGRAHVAGNP